MTRRLWMVLLGASLTLAGCSTAAPGRSPAPPGQPSPGTVPAPVAPNPAPAPPQPVVTPVTPIPKSSPSAAMSSAEAVAAPAPAPTPLLSTPAVALAPPRPYHDILKLKQAGLTDEFILNKVRTDNVNYQLTTSEIVELRSAGISETILEAMMRSGQPPATTSGIEVARKAEFSGLARVGKGFLVFGTSARKTGRLVVDGENVSWFDTEDPKKNFSIYARNIKEVFNTCVLRPGQNLCLEFGFVTHTGEEYRFRDPGWKNGNNKLVLDATTYFRQAFPTLFFSQRAVSEL
jgi:hypothetical protein